jgi:hypothetical protein
LTLQRQVRERVWAAANIPLRSITIDTDTTVHTVYGQQMGARKSYNPKNKGKKSVQPILTFLAETREYLAGQFRNGHAPAGKGSRQTIVLDPEDGAVRLEVEFIVYADQPVVRYRTQLRNRSGADSFVQEADILAWQFGATRGPHRVFRVNQWVGGGHYGNFETFNDELQGEDTVVSLTSGSYGQHCSWTGGTRC